MINIFTDGSCSYNPGPGGFGVVVFKDWKTDIQYFYQEKSSNTTNNREELKAIIHATDWALLNNCQNQEECIIYTDSSYCENIINKWMYAWAENGWRNSKNKQIENKDLITILYNYYTKKNIPCQVKKIKGHNNILGNELADALATFNKSKFNKILKLI